MVALESKLNDELLPEIELAVVPSKLSEIIRVDLFRLEEDFVDFLVAQNIITYTDGSPVDTIEMPLSKFANFCVSIRDTYRKYKVEQNANV